MTRDVRITAAVLAALGLVLGLSGWLDPAHAVVLPVVVLVAVLVWRTTAAPDDGWPDPPVEDRPGGRHDVSELGWAALTRDGTVAERVLRRVRAVASTRLAGHGVLWDGEVRPDLTGWGHDERDAAEHHARAQQLLGPQVLDALTHRRSAHPRTLESWLTALDRLVDAPDHPRSPR